MASPLSVTVPPEASLDGWQSLESSAPQAAEPELHNAGRTSQRSPPEQHSDTITQLQWTLSPVGFLCVSVSLCAPSSALGDNRSLTAIYYFTLSRIKKFSCRTTPGQKRQTETGQHRQPCFLTLTSARLVSLFSDKLANCTSRTCWISSYDTAVLLVSSTSC